MEEEGQEEYDHGYEYRVIASTDPQKDLLHAQIVIHQAKQQIEQERNEEKYASLHKAGFAFL